ncbi:unnamed protein product [Didymodactylos carnosus]|uniref:Cathepsin propeptide inhibitor domain-containing protein n=1 Tax=Didymodactylos carnosus TaxID=1234261 RepID=A0A815J7V6_9BILA|nr:unnamed protein product [Didymodactylos carnosus]CAF1375749.1 unnamed protein product [Didymodactylos carnosus]CAF3925486.1 unnamed protein product [Didymodactylos carnosus]CAF4266039.1 unnamed protein product [Didymodactylos carnosus]
MLTSVPSPSSPRKRLRSGRRKRLAISGLISAEGDFHMPGLDIFRCDQEHAMNRNHFVQWITEAASTLRKEHGKYILIFDMTSFPRFPNQHHTHVLFIGFIYCLGVTANLNAELEWQKFKEQKHYSSAIEEKLRKEIFFDNINYINNHQLSSKYSLKINSFSDRKIVELIQPFCLSSTYEDIHVHHQRNQSFVPPDNFDWRTKGVITNIRNEGQLGDVVDIALEK